MKNGTIYFNLTAAIQAFAGPALAGRINHLNREQRNGKHRCCNRKIFHGDSSFLKNHSTLILKKKGLTTIHAV